MKTNFKITAVICAAGRGERAGFDKNKLLVPFMGANALYYSVKAFKGIADEIIVSCSPADMAEISAICTPMGAKTVTGGKRRTDSVYAALKIATGDIVLVHDGARPYVKKAQIVRCTEDVIKFGSAIVAMPAVDTVAIADGGRISAVPKRSNVYMLQTPQGFWLKELKGAYERAIADGGEFTDDSSVYGAYVAPAHICDCGDGANKKLTYAADFAQDFPPVPKLGQGYAAGIGVDVHAFGKKQDFVVLCGVKIPCDSGLVAHSDGDAPVHATMDAMLSAAGLKDIGNYFPEDDPTYDGADSMQLLKATADIIAREGYAVESISLTIQAQKPRLKKYIDEMRANLGSATGADISRISVGAGTTEGLGFVGEGLGICAYCCAVLKTI